MRNFFRTESKILFALALPVLIAQAAQTAITFVDTIMAGRYSAVDLSGVALGTSIWLPTILFGHGLLAILTPIIAHLNGAAQREKIANQTRQGFILASLISVIIMLILYHSDAIITFRDNTSDASINPEMARIAVDFLRSMMWGVPAYLYFQVCRNQCEGLSNTKPAMFIGFMALILNIPINYAFIYGEFGFPEMGGVGCGIATATIYWFMLLAIKTYVHTARNQRDIRNTQLPHFFDWPTILRIFKLGLPVALAFFFEVSLFALVSLFIAPLGEISVAAHQIVFAISSMTFVIPLSLSVATSIRVSHLLGEKQVDFARYASYIGIGIAFAFSVVVASTLVIFGQLFIRIFTVEPAIIQLAVTLIVLLAIYQCSDYVQVVAASVLRAYKDTKIIFIFTFISYWMVGLPFGYVLALTDHIVPAMGPAGFWIGFITGLSTAAVLMISRMIWLQKQPNDKLLARVA